MSYLGEETPKLGFGMMRLPRNEDKMFDVPQVCDMVDEFMAAGCTYFDTARVYSGSEWVTNRALVERYPRDSFTLATKNAAWAGNKTREDAIATFDTSLEKTGAGYFDYFLLHNVGNTRKLVFDEWGMWEWASGLKDKGLIRHFGFSFHDTADVLRQVLEAHPEVDFVQLQINWADWEDSSVQSRQCGEVAREYEKPVVIMEPIKGGTLSNLPEPVMDILREAEPDRSAAEWALRFAMNVEGLITALSGMSTIEQVQKNVATWKSLTPLSEQERATLDSARKKLKELNVIPCTGCGYCMKQCPVGMNIPGILELYNRMHIYGKIDNADWLVWMMRNKRTGECLHCYQCENACPQHIDIVSQVEKTKELFGV